MNQVSVNDAAMSVNSRLRYLTPWAIAMVRVVIGFVFVMHGWQKLVDTGVGQTGDFFSSLGIPLPDLAATWVTVVELVGGLALILGVATVVVAMLLTVDMVVAFATVHRENGVFVTDNGYELVLVLGASCLMLMVAGPGALALDNRWSWKKPPLLDASERRTVSL